MLASGLSTPNGNGLIGSIANTGAPLLTYQLGQIAKAKQAEGSTAHIGAHAALAALTAALGDNDPLAAALSAGGSEAAIPLIAQTLYGTNEPAQLSSTEKSQLSDIAALIGAGLGGMTGDNAAIAAAAAAGRRAVENNYLTHVTLEKIEKGKISIQNALEIYRTNKENLDFQCGKSQSSIACRDAIHAAKLFVGNVQSKQFFPKQVEETSLLLNKYSQAAQYQSPPFNLKNPFSREMFTGENLPKGNNSDFAKGILTGLKATAWDNRAAATGGAQFGMPVGTFSYNQYEQENPYQPNTQQEFLGATYLFPLATAAAGKVSATSIPKLTKPFGQRVFNGVELHHKLPEPASGWDYTPKLLSNGTPNQVNSHINGFRAELRLANELANSDRVVLKYGDKIGAHGSDVLTVNLKTAEVELWDSKFRQAPTSGKVSPTFTKEPALGKAIREARILVNESNTLPPKIKAMALQNLKKGNVTTYTVGQGGVKSSEIRKVIDSKLQP